MKTLSITPAAFTAAQLAPAIEALRHGRVIGYPTDTLYGLGGDPRSPAAAEAIFSVKGRPGGQSLPLIAADVAQVLAMARLSVMGQRLVERFWPGPLTLVLRSTVPLAEGVAASDGTVALRVPDHPVARALARDFGFAITSTSANRSGEPPAATAAEARAGLAGAIAVLVDAGAAPGGPPSTIVDVTQEVPRLVRAGAVAWDRVLESLE